MLSRVKTKSILKHTEGVRAAILHVCEVVKCSLAFADGTLLGNYYQLFGSCELVGSKRKLWRRRFIC